MSEQAVSEMSFEQSLGELESVVAKLERGDVPLEDSIALYQRGAELKAHCETKLKDAEEKVHKITLGADGQAEGTAPVEGL